MAREATAVEPMSAEQIQELVDLGAGVSGVSLEQAINELDRERRVRERCYPKWVAEDRLSKVDSEERLARVTAAQKFLEKLLDRAKAAQLHLPG